MKIEYTKINFLYMEEKFLAHGCNTIGVMGAGVAKAVRSKFPEAYKDYKVLCESHKEDRNELLGTVQAVESKNKMILNCFTQFGIGSGVQVDYEAVRSCFKIINAKAKELGITRIGMPKIGSGLAGGNWEMISSIIEEESTNFQPVVSQYTR